MQTFTLDKATVNFDRLTRELLAAAPALVQQGDLGDVARFSVVNHPTTIDLIVPEDVASAVQAAIAAHNPAVPDAFEQQQTADAASLSDFAAQYQVALNAIDTIQTHMTTITGTTFTTIGQANVAFHTIADDINTLCVGLERILKALRTIAKRQEGV